MFVALELPDCRDGAFVRKVKRLLGKPRAQLLEMEAAGCSYWLIRAPVPPGEEPPWEEIEDLAGHLAGRMLLPEGVHPPEDSRIHSIACPEFEKRVLLDTACQLIHRTRMPMYRRLLGLVDPQGEYTGLLGPLLKYFTAVQVVTRAALPYALAAEQMMEEMGAPVMVGDSYAALRDCVLILLPDGADTDWNSEFLCPILTGNGVSPDKNKFIISGLEMAAAEDLKPFCPLGISPHRLAGALFEDQGLQFDNYAADKMFYRYKSCGMGDIVREIGQEAGTLTLF